MQAQKRSEIDAKYKWKLEDIFADNEAWEAEFAEMEAMLPALSALKEHIADNVDTMRDGLQKIDRASWMLERLFVYARMRRDEDSADSVYQGLASRAQNLAVRLSGALSFLDPLLLSLDEQTLSAYIHAPELTDYSFMLENLLRSKAHVLDEKSERLLSMAGDFSDGAQEIFTMLDNADLKFGEVEHEGRAYPITHAKYMELMQSPDRALREKVYRKYYEAFSGHINTIAATYSTAVRKDIFYAKARGYESARNKALFADNVPPAVYTDLIDTVHENLGTMYDYLRLRGRALGIKNLEMYDVYAPLVPEVDAQYTYEQAQDIVLEALGALGEDYTGMLRRAYADGWIDVYETPGKRSGAYSWGVYGTHPYVLLNHRSDLDSVFTLAHELGHAMHTFYSDGAQPYAKAGYAIFVAEVASTVNEILLTKHLLRTVSDPALKKYVLNHYIDQFRTTVLRQTMFAEFEMLTHDIVSKGGVLTADQLCELYLTLNKKYFGEEMISDPEIAYEWARIPHFYTPFYVYQYATGFAAAIAISSKILKGEEGIVEKYKQFLSGGSSMDPIDLLKLCDVDMSAAQPIEEALDVFEKYLNELEKVYKTCKDDND